jgi:catechol 2,3-dioxygenase-like lactoylglutathione lyase family enzyme
MIVNDDQADAGALTSCHIEVHVTDLAAARHFYVEQLGMAVLQQAPAIALLAVKAGGIRVSIFGDRAAADQAGPTHLVLGTIDLDREIGRLQARGVVFEEPVIEAPGFCRFIQTRDPDGNLVEIAQYLRDPLVAV